MEIYIKSIILIGALSSAVIAFLPNGGTSKYVSFAAQLVTLLVIIYPLSGAIGIAVKSFPELPRVEVEESQFCENVLSYSADSISRAISEHCAEKFSLDTENIRIRLIIDDSDIQSVKLTEVQLFISEANSERRHEICNYFEEMLQCRVYVFGA